MWTLTQFRLRQYLMQGRTTLIFVIIIILAIFNALVFQDVFRQDVIIHQDYRRQHETYCAQAKDYSPSLLLDAGFIKIDMPAPALKFIADNEVESVPSSRTINPYFSRLPTSSAGGGQGAVTHDALDLSFLVSVVITFFAFVLTYDSICGQKQSGTLRMMMASSLPRSSVYLSNVYAAFITLSLPLALSLIINTQMLNIFGALEYSVANLLIIASFAGLSMLLLFLFVTVGVTVSALTRTPMTSLIILLLVWIVFVQVLPGAAKLTGKTLVQVRLLDEFHKDLSALERQFEALVSEREAHIRPRDFAAADGYKNERLYNDLSEEHWGGAIRNAIEGYLRALCNQSEVVRGLSRLSPTMVFRMAVSRLTNSDLPALMEFYSQVERYRAGIFNIVGEADSRDPDSAHLLYVLRGYASDKPLAQELPRFRYVPPALGPRLVDALPDLLILLSLSLGTLLGGVLAMNRYDVR